MMISSVEEEYMEIFETAEDDKEPGAAYSLARDDDGEKELRSDDENGDTVNEEEKTKKSADGKTVTPRRVIRNPQPKLDADRLCGKRGLTAVLDTFKDVKLKGKHHELEDVELVMKRLEHWGHRLFPKLPFDDLLNKVEKLGSKKPVQTHVKKIRMDMLSDESSSNATESAEARPKSQSSVSNDGYDPFDELVSTANPGALTGTNPEVDSVVFTSSEPASRPMISTEIQQRIEENRRQAEERRKLRLLHQQQQAIHNPETLNTSLANEPSARSSELNCEENTPSRIAKDDSVVREESENMDEEPVPVNESDEEVSVADIMSVL
nr:EOG090X0AVC [Triops cancriformis]